MNVHLDHVFVTTEPGAAVAGGLAAAGLREGEPNRHVGQGTANRRFFFATTFLEWLYVVDTTEATASSIARTCLAERCAGAGCPFGLAVRVDGALPFPTWPFRPPYLPPKASIPMAETSDDPQRVLLFAIPKSWASKRRLVHHPVGADDIVEVCLEGPSVESDPALGALRAPWLARVDAPRWRMRLALSGGRQPGGWRSPDQRLEVCW